MIAVARLQEEPRHGTEHIIDRHLAVVFELTVVDPLHRIGNVDDLLVGAGAGDHDFVEQIMQGIGALVGRPRGDTYGIRRGERAGLPHQDAANAGKQTATAQPNSHWPEHSISFNLYRFYCYP